MQAPQMMAPDFAAGNLIQQVRILALHRSPAALKTPSIT